MLSAIERATRQKITPLELPTTEVQVDGKKTPYGHELWLPLFWFFVGGEA